MLRLNRLKKILPLEALRGLAALYVVLHHGFWLLWEGREKYLSHPENYNLFTKIIAEFSRLFFYGHEMVLFFFVLSGFVIHIRYSRNLQKNDDSIHFRSYLKRRVLRIYPALIFALLFTYLLDQTGRYLQLPSYFHPRIFPPGVDRYSLTTLIGNLALMMNTYVPVWGSNVPLWSLKFEFWFYLLFPLFFLLLKRSASMAFLVQVALFTLSFFPFLWPVRLLNDVFTSMIIWWLGVFLADVYTGRVKVKMKYLCPLVLAIPAVFKFKEEMNSQIYDLIWGLGFVGFLSIIFQFEDKISKWNLTKMIAPMGAFSYSLYITHRPIQFFMNGLIGKYYQNLPSHFNFLYINIVVVILFAYLIHFLIEKPFLSPKETTLKRLPNPK